MKRQKWVVKNITTDKTLTIGDLPRVPAFDPGKSVDILAFYTKDIAEQSKILLSLISKGWVVVIKTTDGMEPISITASSNPSNGLTTAFLDQVIGGGGGDGNIDGGSA